MNTAIDLLNSGVALVADPLMRLLAFLPGGWSLALISILLGVILLLVYGRVSNQQKLAKTKRAVMGSILEALLFRHDVRIAARAQAGLFANGIRYFLCAVPPILILAIPTILVLAQLNMWYGVRGLNPGEEAIVSLKLDSNENLYRISVTDAAGLKVSPPVRVNSTNQLHLKVELEKPADAVLRLKVGDKDAALPIVAGDRMRRIGAIESQDWATTLLYPKSGALGGNVSAIQELAIAYPGRTFNITGFEAHWVIGFLIVSILAGLVAAKVFHVEI